jgi:hypothetical protein
MRSPVPTPTPEPLPFRIDDGQPFDRTHPPTGQAPLLRSDSVARFDAFLHELNPDAVRVDVDRMQHLLEWLMTLPEAEAHEVLDRRLQRLDELRAMLDDPDWDADEAMQMRLRKLFAYIDCDDDLIADHEPLLGLLDDVLLVELAWPAFSSEVEEYRDFSAYRNDEHPVGSGEDQRTAWIRDRMAELALWEHNLRVHESHYIHRGHPEDFFHVG